MVWRWRRRYQERVHYRRAEHYQALVAPRLPLIHGADLQRGQNGIDRAIIHWAVEPGPADDVLGCTVRSCQAHLDIHPLVKRIQRLQRVERWVGDDVTDNVDVRQRQQYDPERGELGSAEASMSRRAPTMVRAIR